MPLWTSSSPAWASVPVSSLLKKGALPVLIFLLLATIMVTIQDLVGVGMAGVFGLDGRMGLCMGSVPLVGGHGTSASFGQLFEKAGVDGALTVAVACATYGLVAGSLMGRPSGADGDQKGTT